MITNLSYEQICTKYQFNKHIWEGWEVGDFIRYIEDDLDRIMEYGYGQFADPVFKTKEEITGWIRNNLPYTVKALRYVAKYFIDKYNGMPISPWCNPDGSKTLKLK